MDSGRIEAFSDGVLAILITIMVLELHAPEHTSLTALKPLVPVFAAYVLSFVFVGIYWNNHHHLFHATEQVDGAVLWANLHLLFWLSMIPFATAWMGEHHFATIPVAVSGLLYLLAAVAYVILQEAIIHAQSDPSVLRAALGSDVKGKLSMLLYVAAIGLAFVNHWIAVALFVAVAIMWFVPDRRLVAIAEGSSPEAEADR
ncbi:MAG: DUF1211 domain-containing protein [Actinobacteria bacterium]|nr:DUF1211 domain-containing protein [Actinomycetota bacterium]